MTPELEKDFQNATKCHICEESFCEQDLEWVEKGQIFKKGGKVRDHCHFTGVYRGAAHEKCNLALRKVKDIPVFFHNLSGYDSHFIFQNLTKVKGVKQPEVIAKSMEKFITFSIGNLKFKDSLNFLSASLDKLVSNLGSKGDEHFKNLKAYFQDKWNHLPERAFKMLTRKGVYPYSYMDSFDKFKEEKLPSKESFYNDLCKQHISQEDYDFIHELWNTFKLKNLGQLHDLYMEVDTLQLADVFETFRDRSLKNYRLDPAHFSTLPSLTWQAGLKYTSVELEIPRDIDMQIFFDRGLTGGISMVANQYAKANNPLVDESNSNKENSYIGFFDCNNQYGWAMCQYLPTHGFEWVPSDEYSTEFFLKQKDDQSIGYMVEVDLEYPKELHDLHDTYPLAPEHLNIQKDMLSNYQKDLADNLGVKIGGDKLCLTLSDKKNYVCHYRNLRLYLEKGMRIQKVHRVLKFKQSAWLKDYIDLNTSLRQGAENKFEQSLFKLMNNSLFGKTCEDVRKYKEIRIATTDKRSKKLIAKPTAKQWKIYDENLVAVQLKRVVVQLNKPRYVGMCILDISKTIMYKFHYDFIMKQYPNAKLLFTDTDSFCYDIPTKTNMYEDIKVRTDWFDFSNYDKDHPNYDTSNDLVPGKFKDEMGGKPITEFVGLRSKMYSIKTQEGTEKKTAKGVLKAVKEKDITHENYKQCLFNEQQMKHKQTRIIQEEHKLYTATQNKTSLSPFNDKKWITREGDQFTSYSFHHYKLE